MEDIPYCKGLKRLNRLRLPEFPLFVNSFGQSNVIEFFAFVEGIHALTERQQFRSLS